MASKDCVEFTSFVVVPQNVYFSNYYIEFFLGIVSLTHSLLPAAPIHIQIFPTSEIELIEDPNLILTNGAKDNVVRVVLVLQSEKSVGIKTNNLVSFLNFKFCIDM